MSIHIKKTDNPTIRIFESDDYKILHSTDAYYELKNISECANFPIAQKLFSYPFISQVSLSCQNIAIQINETIDWEMIAEDIAQNIQQWLDDGFVAHYRPMITVYIENTPNPEVNKFVSNQLICEQQIEVSLQDDIPCQFFHKLFENSGVQSVFIEDNYVSVTKNPTVEWNDINMEIRELLTYLLSDAQLVQELVHTADHIENKSPVIQDKTTLDSISLQIIEALETYVKPAVASDGGDIVFQSYDADLKSVKVFLKGACNGCPSSTITLKNGIEMTLKEEIGEEHIHTVEALN